MRRYVYAAVWVALVAGCGDSTSPTPTPGPPASLQIVSGDLQSGTVGTELTEALIVRVVDADGVPVLLQVVNFRVTAGGGAVFAGVGLTDSAGQARERWTLGTVAGDTQTVEARAVDNQTGAPLVFGTFKALGLPDAPVSMAKRTGDLQVGQAGAALPESLSVRLADQYDNGVPGVTVSWAPLVGGGTVTSASTTDADGIAWAGWTLGTRRDTTQAVRAAAAMLDTLTFVANALLPNNAALSVAGGDGQQGVVGGALLDSLVVQVSLADGRPVVGETVTWTVTGGGGSITQATTKTDVNGQARTSWTLGTTAGPQSVAASVLGLGSVTLTGTGQPGPAATITRLSGNAQFGDLGKSLGDSLAVLVKDQHGNPVNAATVDWSVLAGGGTIVPTTTTDADGIGRAAWELGTRLDTTHVAEASVVGLAPVRFTATPRLPSSAVVVKLAGDAQSDTVESMLADSLAVRVQLADGRGVSGAVVRWSGGAGQVFTPDSALTDGNGRAATAWRVGTTAGTASAHAAVSGLQTATFTATVLPGQPASVLAFSGNNQTAPASTVLPDSLAARVLDRFGNSVPSASVSWQVTTGGGTVSPSTSTTDALGLARAQWTLGSLGGQQTLAATTSGLLATVFVATAGTPAGFLAISAGGSTEDSHTCAIHNDHKAFCWGKASRFGQLGTGTNTNSPVPVAVTGGLDFDFIEAGGYYTCGIDTSGDIYCWGYNYYGQLGDGTRTTVSSPVMYAGAVSLSTLHVGGQTTCGTDASGAAYCWGWGPNGERGDGVYSEVQTAPVAVSGNLTFSSLEIGAGYHTCGVASNGDAYCWGSNRTGALGTTATTEFCPGQSFPCASTPIPVQGGLKFQFVEPGGQWGYREHTCGLTTGGQAYCWGRNDLGQLGDGTNTDSGTPTAVSGGLTFSSLSVHGEFACALTAGGQAYCWGSNQYGQLGNGTTTNSSVPVPVTGGLTFTALDAGAYHACGLTAAGVAYCWGRNNDGQLGNGTTVDSSVPVQVTNP